MTELRQVFQDLFLLNREPDPCRKSGEEYLLPDKDGEIKARIRVKIVKQLGKIERRRIKNKLNSRHFMPDRLGGRKAF